MDFSSAVTRQPTNSENISQKVEKSDTEDRSQYNYTSSTDITNPLSIGSEGDSVVVNGAEPVDAETDIAQRSEADALSELFSAVRYGQHALARRILQVYEHGGSGSDTNGSSSCLYGLSKTSDLQAAQTKEEAWCC